MDGADIIPAHIESFYRAALLGLRALDARAGGRRRFGDNADARWQAFRGELHDGDRIDLLLRDAAATSSLGFAPHAVFALEGLPSDEPFGPDWTGPSRPLTTELLRAAEREAGPGDLAALLGAAARAWGITAAPPEALPAIRPATRLLAAGAGAVLALGAQFDGRGDLDLADQVLLVSAAPAVRQLFGLAVAWQRGPARARVLPPGGATAEAARAAGFPHCEAVVLSPDADPGEREAALLLSEALRG